MQIVCDVPWITNVLKVLENKKKPEKNLAFQRIR